MELQREALIDVAMGYASADTVITNGHVVNVHTGTVKAEGIAIKGERIAAVGDVEYTVGDRTEVIDAASETRLQAELGIWIVIREGSDCKDIEACLPVITKEGYHPRAFQLCTDVITPDWMLARGQMDNAIRVAVQNGLDSMTAIQMSTIQPAEF